MTLRQPEYFTLPDGRQVEATAECCCCNQAWRWSGIGDDGLCMACAAYASAPRPEPAPERRPSITIDPLVKAGRPTVSGTRLLVQSLAVYVWGGWTDAEILEYWDYLTRGDLILACWYQATQTTPVWRRRWGSWAERVFPALYGACTAEDYATMPWPPVRTRKGG